MQLIGKISMKGEAATTAFAGVNFDQLGVVVIGRNEGERLRRCLVSLRANAATVVYVDSGSTDGSPEVASEFNAVVVRLNLSIPFTAARARNEGFYALKAIKPDVRWVQFVDGDCEIVNGWLQAALQFITPRPDIAVVCGRRRERYPDASIYTRLCDLEWDTLIGQALACGGDSLMRVEAFEAVGGFRPELIAGEEPELCVRLREKNWKIWRLDAEMTRHDAALTQFKQWWTRTVRGGYGYAEVAKLHRGSASGIWARETLSALLWGGLLPLTVILGALIHPATLWLTFVYPIQVARIAMRRGPRSIASWTYSIFIMIAKFGEFQGIAKFFWYSWRGQQIGIIEYKYRNNCDKTCADTLRRPD
jgi:glycosyltransferase involved in cell wall biosynthesis